MPKGGASSALGLILRPVVTMVGDTIRMALARNKKAVSYAVAGQNISGTIYYPKSNDPAPCILVLPTAMGLTPHEHVIAARLAREGYTTLALGYLGHLKRTTGVVLKNEQTRNLLEQIVMQGWRKLLEDPLADANHAAAIGFSLGGYFATLVAIDDKQLPPKAVIIYYGVYPFAEPERVFPPTPLLVLQGEDDDTEFVTNARALKARHAHHAEVIFYPGTGHQFDLFEPNSAATKDAWERTVGFLRRHLMPPTARTE